MILRHILQYFGLALLFSISFTGTAYAASCSAQDFGIPAYGKRGVHIKNLQECLIGVGYALPSGATGYYGNETRAAVIKFYHAVLNIPDWDGRSIGPKGRAELARRAGGAKIPVVSTAASQTMRYIRVANETDLMKRFEAKSEVGGFFPAYSMGLSGRITAQGMGVPVMPTSAPTMSVAEAGVGADTSYQTPGRVSETNVQVAGIDEPDIVKTDGKHLYVAHTIYGKYDVPVEAESTISSTMIAPCTLDGGCIVPPRPMKQGGVTALRAFPPSALAIASESISEYGEMLLVKEKSILLVLGQNAITAYNVANPAAPAKMWTNELKNNTERIAARLKDGTLYLLTRTYLNRARPCPIVPMLRGGVSVEIACGDIWMPSVIEPADSTYAVFTIDPTTGKETNSLTFLADSTNTTVYMSGDNLFVANHLASASGDVMMGFFTDELPALLSAPSASRIREIAGYNISYISKINEISAVIEKEISALSVDAQLKFENEMENRLQSYTERRMREMDKTAITKIALGTLTITAAETVPGHLLNQFSMDEYRGNLRVAVTVGETWGWSGGKTMNDVYVLDGNLKVLGSVKDLGLTERIYAARFIGDKGYLVTFRQTDPFYVLDLSNPAIPKMTGELKIPGYSAYLEPISDQLVLGVGREGGGVKISLFDVTNPSAPSEKAKYALKDGWTEVEGNHHAFLKDDKHQVFFIPGGNGGYVLSYAGSALELKYAISGWNIKRAVYIDDYLYVIGTNKIVVIDENSWKEIRTLAY